MFQEAKKAVDITGFEIGFHKESRLDREFTENDLRLVELSRVTVHLQYAHKYTLIFEFSFCVVKLTKAVSLRKFCNGLEISKMELK